MAGERTIGFIGVGRMGLPMASRLIDAGHRLIAYDTQGQALSAIANKGAEKAASPAEVASRAEIVMASLPRPETVREVALGERGVAAGSKVRLFIDLYPAIYKGKETRPNNYRLPQLTYADDHPGEDLPRFRFAFEVTPPMVQ